MSKIFPFKDLACADLIVDAIYESGTSGNAGDDPISKLMKCGNQGGFRYIGSYDNLKLCVLYSEMTSTEWPDEIDSQKGLFTYFGDNKTPGHELHDTKKKGNEILRLTFESLHNDQRSKIPPFFIFTKANDKGRSVIFRGLAVPGAINLNKSEDLVAVWKRSGDRFLNYRGVFSILDTQTIKRDWIDSIINSNENTSFAPDVYLKWQKSGTYKPLVVEESSTFKTPLQQLPQSKLEGLVISRVIDFFKNEHIEREYAFEKCAVEVAKMLPGVISCDRTRPWKDGGRDATGIFRIGTVKSYTDVEYALEAKCKGLDIGSTVKETSRLISRIKHRQFGIFITTSYLAEQAYKEILEDKHPVLILSATDSADILIKKLDLNAENTKESILKLNDWLQQF